MNEPSATRLERVLGKVLRAGTIASTALLAAGLGLQLVGLVPVLSARLTTAGLLVLMATPVMRVVVSVGGYARQRDWLFLTLTASVLVILLGSLLVGVM